MIDVGVHCSCWLDREENLQRRRSSIGSEGIGKYLKRRKGEGLETKNICDVEGLQRQRSRGNLWELEVYKLVRQLETLCEFSVTHLLTWTLYLLRQASLEYHWDYFLCLEHQQRGSAHWHASALINHGGTSDSEDIDEWEWRSMLEDDDQGWQWILHCAMMIWWLSYYTRELHHCYNCK